MSADGSGYKCRKCNYTGYSYGLKIPFVATDGTTEAEMICFGNTASRIIGTSTQSSTSRLLPQHQSTSPSVPAINISPHSPHVIQPEAIDAPPFNPDTPDDLPARKRLFSSNIDDKQESGGDSVKKIKLDLSIDDVKEDCLSPTSPQRSSSGIQINQPTQYSTKKLQHQKKK
ncbi:unnamed protein product [Urochloa humidicola]